MSRSKHAFLFSAENLPVNEKGNVYLWTFTARDAVDVEVFRLAWSKFCNVMNERRRKGGNSFEGVRVFEMHKSHGLHCHVVTASWWNVNEIRALWQAPRDVKRKDGSTVTFYGGRVHVKPFPAVKISYLAKYLSKQHRPECLKGVSLWRVFGKFAGLVRVKDVECDSPWTRAYQGICASVGEGFRKLPYWKRLQAVANVLNLLPWYFGLSPDYALRT